VHQWRRDVVMALGGVAAIAVIIASLRALQTYPNATIAALLLLLVVLATATLARLRVAIAISVAAMLAFNFFLLPPFHTFTIADPQNWVALFVFLAVANIASQLSAAARQRASEAEARRMEVTRLFDLSRDILLTTDSDTAVADLARYVARRFELDAVAVCLPAASGWHMHQGADRVIEPSRDQLDVAFARLRGPLEYDARHRAYGGHVEVPGAPGQAISLVPLRLGSRPVGLLATDRGALEVGTLDALGGVVAIAIERAHFLAERKKAEALSQRADLASALLASFSHDLRTPVTSVRVAVANLQDPGLSRDDREVQSQLALQELDRLTHVLQDILDMARIDAAVINPERQWVSPGDLVDAAVTYVGPALGTRTLEIDADQATEILVDPKLTSSALAHLLENAARYSPPARPIGVRAWAEADGVHLIVRDHGPGLDPADLDHVFEPFYRSAKVRHSTGSGLGLAITRGLLAAEGGRVWCENVNSGGAQFTIVVPGSVRTVSAEVT
jgi:two-component system, OmpR family, sensor histidine kinase KdpD